MKYQVNIKFTNPSHEHISLRRRVDSITRIVEANSEDEALNRAANQQRALGFLIREAAVVKDDPKEENLHADEKSKKKKKVVGDDHEETEIAAAGGVKKEEVEVVDEAAKDWKKAFSGVAQKNLQKDIGKMRSKVGRLNYIGMQPKVDMSQKVTAKAVKRPAVHSEAADPDKRDAGYKMSPAVRAAQKKSDALSKPEKKHQAGTLGANKARKAAEKMVNKAKGKANKINMTPEIEPGKPNA